MPRFLPENFPHDLRRRPKRSGEKAVWNALAAALADDWLVLYDRPIPGSRRRIDFLCLHPRPGLLALEVKGGLVHHASGRFRQAVGPTAWRFSKKIDPFGQSKCGLADLGRAFAVDMDATPRHLALVVPLMAATAFTWKPGPHVWTRECLEADRLRDAVHAALPVLAARDARTVKVLAEAETLPAASARETLVPDPEGSCRIGKRAGPQDSGHLDGRSDHAGTAIPAPPLPTRHVRRSQAMRDRAGSCGARVATRNC